MKIFTTALFILFVFGCSQANKSGDEKSDTTETETAIQSAGEAFEITLPDNAKLLDDQPMGDNWVNLLENEDNWILDEANWEINDTLLHGDYHGGELHNYGWTRQQYGDFELHAVVRMSGDEANSGVCIRINPEDANSVPGYQVDMGPGYWGSLWEEGRAGMVQKYPDESAAKLVNADDWNHYYVRAEGHKIEAWLNGVKTIDTVHQDGFLEGSIGFQLCHGEKHTVLDVKNLYLRNL